MRYFKFVLLLLLCSTVKVAFAQSQSIDSAIEERIRRISAMVVEQVNLQSEPSYYIPSFGFGFRFGGETLFNGQVSNPTIPMFGWFVDAHFLRFSAGFGILRLLIETPFSSTDTTFIASDLALINSTYSLSGGFGGGFRFLDSRIKNGGKGNVLTFSFLGIVGSRIGTKASLSTFATPTTLFGGAEVEFEYQYYFHRYASIRLGWSFGLRFGATSTATYNFNVGMSF